MPRSDWMWEPSLEDLRGLNVIRIRVGLPPILEGEIKTAQQWWRACDEVDQLAEEESDDQGSN